MPQQSNGCSFLGFDYVIISHWTVIGEYIIISHTDIMDVVCTCEYMTVAVP